MTCQTTECYKFSLGVASNLDCESADAVEILNVRVTDSKGQDGAALVENIFDFPASLLSRRFPDRWSF